MAPMMHNSLSVRELQEGLARGTWSAVELAEDCIARALDESDVVVRIFESARGQAAAWDEMRDAAAFKGAGVPVLVKDVINVRDEYTSLGIEGFPGIKSHSDARSIAILRAAGLVVVGHVRSMECADGSSAQLLGNPIDPRFSPGGSSNGSAVAVAKGISPISLGTDSGGSIRRPASACGMYAYMPTHNPLLNEGVWTTNPSGVSIGVIAQDFDSLKLASAPFWPRPYGLGSDGASRDGVRGETFIVLDQLISNLDEEIRIAFDQLVAWIAEEGGSVVRSQESIDLPQRLEGDPEFLEAHARYAKSITPFLSEHTKTRIQRNRQRMVASAADLASWRHQREETARRIEHSMRKAGAGSILLPAQTLPVPPRDGGFPSDIEGFGSKELREIFNTTGFPALALPLSRDSRGLPFGIQLAGARSGDAQLFDVASGINNILQSRGEGGGDRTILTPT